MGVDYEEESINLRKAWVGAQITELGRLLPGMVVLIDEKEKEDVKLVLERILYDCWDTAQKPLLKALAGKLLEPAL